MRKNALQPRGSGLDRAEFAILRRLNTPEKIQAYIDSMPQNFEIGGETCCRCAKR